MHISTAITNTAVLPSQRPVPQFWALEKQIHSSVAYLQGCNIGRLAHLPAPPELVPVIVQKWYSNSLRLAMAIVGSQSERIYDCMHDLKLVRECMQCIGIWS